VQLVHEVDVEEANKAEAVPAAQLAQAAWPVVEAYLPATQLLQVGCPELA
jgi:hypothetical protein